MTATDLPADRAKRALDQAQRHYVERNPTSQAGLRRASHVMPGGNTRTVLFYEPFPLMMTHGAGARLWDADGREYIDFLGEFSAGLYGHSHPVIHQAINAALATGLSLSGPNHLESELAHLIVERFTSIDLVRFTNSGTEASLLALGLARVVTGRSKILVFEGAYHGSVLGFTRGLSPINIPYEFIIGRYNDIDMLQRCVTDHADDLAAIIAEPMLGAAGCIPGDPEFLAAIEESAHRTGALFILDEVQTSRLSSGGRQALLGLSPDLTILGKYIGGGSSFGALGGRRDLMERFDPRRANALPHAGTFNNNVISMMAGAAGLREIYTPMRAQSLNAAGDALRDRLNLVCARAGAPLQFTGLGSLMNAHAIRGEIRHPGDLQAASEALLGLLFFHLLEAGLYIAHRGLITLMISTSEADIEILCGAVERFLDRYIDLWRSEF